MREKHHRFGDLIHQEKDDLGEILVYQKEAKRFLTFGSAIEQSCFNLARPWQLEHEYTRVMMLGLLLHEDIRSALLLGLGAGSLARALRHARPKLHIDAVDYRMAVIRIAEELFELRKDKHLHLHCDDAQRYLDTDSGNHDLIFTDLYLEHGAHEAQQSGNFLMRVRQQLSVNGILMMNQWCNNYRDYEMTRQATYEAFGDRLLHLHTHGGNVVAFAFNGDLPNLKRSDFFDAAQRLGLELDIPLQKHARNFWQQNAEALQLGRFALIR